MKIELLRMKNYIGIYNGLGREEITIDFSKSKHKIILIKGDNGSGKTTIDNAASPLPDDNSSFIPEKPAEKELIISNNNIRYHILFIHDVKADKSRDTTKAYIDKIFMDGREVSLNPNGNVTSFKDVIYNEFNLDPNFIALSKIGGDNRGLADKSPAERKKFVTSIIETLEVYNNIHKTLSKRSSIFKSMINNITTKLDSIGDENKVKSVLSSLESRINGLVETKNKYIEQIASNKSMIQLIDPNSTIQDTYEKIYQSIKESNDEKENIILKINNEIRKTKISNISEENIMDLYNQVTDKINTISTDIQIIESTITNLLVLRENDNSNLQTKIEKLNSIKNKEDFDNLEKSLNDCKANIAKYEGLFSEYNIKNAFNITKDEYITGLNILRDIKNSIDVLKSHSYFEIIQDSINSILENRDLLSELSVIEDAINGLNENIQNDNIEYTSYANLYSIASRLDQRPDDCKIDSCPFIKDAINANNQSPYTHMIELKASIDDNNIILENMINKKEKLINIIEAVNNIKIIFRSIDNYSSILNKLPNGDIFTNKHLLLKRIQNNDSFEDIEDLYKFIEYSNIFDLYKDEKNKLIQLNAKYSIYESKNSIIDEIMKDIDSINKNLNKIIKNIDDNQSLLKDNKVQLSKFKDLEMQLNAIISLYNQKGKIEKNIEELGIQFSNIRNDMSKIKGNIDNVNRLMELINNINSELNPIMEDRDQIKHNLILLNDYKVELDEYTKKYDKVETIKYYSSPSTGIQTVFMDLYMNKIISLANELLSYLFNGKFVLERFIINEKEFKIPCKGDGLRNDDISSMSTSEICLISMVLSFAILIQSSTKYNILRLDEIDGGLSTSNRIQFLYVLDKLIEMLNVEQCIIISHNSEINFSNVDLILLKNDDYDQINAENVIFDANL